MSSRSRARRSNHRRGRKAADLPSEQDRSALRIALSGLASVLNSTVRGTRCRIARDWRHEAVRALGLLHLTEHRFHDLAAQAERSSTQGPHDGLKAPPRSGQGPGAPSALRSPRAMSASWDRSRDCSRRLWRTVAEKESDKLTVRSCPFPSNCLRLETINTPVRPERLWRRFEVVA